MMGVIKAIMVKRARDKKSPKAEAAAECNRDYSVLIIPSDHSPLRGGGRGYRIDTATWSMVKSEHKILT